MSAQRLREAATKLRERAEVATPGPWSWVEEHGRDYTDEGWSHVGVCIDPLGPEVAATAYPGGPDHGHDAQADATYIALMAPPVALALADWLDSVHDAMVPDPGRSIVTIDEQHALKIADTILGPTP